MTANPLLNLGFKIPFDRIRPEHAEPAVDTLLAANRENLERLAAAPGRKFEAFMDDLDTLTDQLDTVSTVCACTAPAVKRARDANGASARRLRFIERTPDLRVRAL